MNESEMDFTPAADGSRRIRYGLSAVRNVGAGVVQGILDARRAAGAFTSFTDFCRKVDPGVLHKKCLESLILAGAFDSLGYTRQGLLVGYEKVVNPILSDRRAEAIGQESFFGGDGGPLLDIDESVLAGEEFDKPRLLSEEKGVLGQFVTDHPLLAVREALAGLCDMEISELPSLGDGDVVTVGGIVGAVGRKYTKRGEPYAVLRLEDLAGGVGIVAFPSVYEKSGPIMAVDQVVLVKGRIDLRGRELQLAAIEIWKPELSGLDGGTAEAGATEAPGRLVVEVPAAQFTRGMLQRLKEILAAHPGRTPVEIHYVNGHVVPAKVGDGYCVDATEGLLSELRRLLGPGAVRVELTADAPEPAEPAVSLRGGP